MHHPAIILSGSKLSNWISKIKESWLLSLNKAGVQPIEPSLFHPILRACSKVSMRHGKSLHAFVIKLGLESCTSIGNSIMDLYVKAGHTGSTLTVFGCMKMKDSVSWNILISGHLHHGDFHRGLLFFMQARATGYEPNISTLVLVIQTIRNLGDLCQGQKMHGYMMKSDFLAISSSLQNSLLSMYADMAMEFARKLFDEMCNRDVIAWSVIISGYVKFNEAHVGLGLFREMVSQLGAEVDGQAMVSALKACTNLKDLVSGRLCHGFVYHKGFGYDLFVRNSLVDMYSKCGDPDSALQAWREMPLRNIVSWNSLLSGFVCNEKHSEALDVFGSMQKEVGMEPDAVTLVNLLQACKHLADPVVSKSIHSVILRRNYELNELVMNALIDVYAKCNLICCARKVFSWMKIRDSVCWSTMIGGLTYCGLADEAIRVFQEMMMEAQEKPNAITILNLMEACSLYGGHGVLTTGHGIAVRRGLASEAIVGTAILNMYSGYGDIISSKKAFYQIYNKNVVSFSAMIAAYGMNGLARDALCLVTEMEIMHGVKPNSITTLSVLSACSHGGLIEEGMSYFKQLTQTQLSLQHYSCLVDLLSRGGKVDIAMEVMLNTGAGASASAWGALLSGCRSNRGNEEIGERAVSCVVELEPNKSGGYMVASSMYAAAGLWEDAARMRRLVRDKEVKVVAGYSMLHVNNKCVRFLADNKCVRFLAGDGRNLSDTVEELHQSMKMVAVEMQTCPLSTSNAS